MIRVLHIMGCSDVGGISTVVLNYYRFIDRSRIHFDIALTVPEAGRNARALEALGARIHFLPLKSEGIGAFRRALAELLEKEQYDAVHVHENETSYVALQVAKKQGIRCRIAHSHTSSPYEGFKGEVRRLSGCFLNYPYASRVIGCGKLAGDRVFGSWNMRRPRAMVLPNAIDAQRFSFDPDIRREVREELGLHGKYVLGMVGRLSEEKNYPFALDMIHNIRKEIPECMLVIAGGGEEEEKLRSQIKDLNISDCVMLLGRRNDVDRLYQAFDLFLLPSFHEGFPVAPVEAMASGLPVLLSAAVTRELEFGSAVEYLPLDDLQQWCTAVHRRKDDSGRETRQAEVKAAGLDIRDTARLLEQVYEADMSCRD